MSNLKGYTYEIRPNGGNAENASVHQTNPAWVLTFLRWNTRDTLRSSGSPTSIRPPLVVENDCIQISVSDSKSVLTPNLSATLLMTDVNYLTAIAPGDFVFANMLNWKSDAEEVAKKARSLRPINGVEDGFKGIFKVQSVRRVLSVNPQTGTKTVAFKITAFAFTEFNNTVYFSSYLLDKSDQNLLLFMSNLSNNWSQFISNTANSNVQNIISFLINSFIGAGVSENNRVDAVKDVTSNVHFYMPPGVGSLLGLKKSVKAAKDIFNYLFGIQKYSPNATSLGVGMNPAPGSQQCQGDVIAKPEYWNQIKVWAILQQFVNSPLNELYTCFRLSRDGRVLPTVVFRQIPFTSEGFKSDSGHPVTSFMTLPRWKISPAMVFDLDIGRDETARINFVQVFGKTSFGPEGANTSFEIAAKNYLYDKDDVARSGLRPYVISGLFDDVANSKELFRSPSWARIIGDALIGGHLKLNGTINCVGIVEPIAVGDNLEFDGVVYHIEQVSHTCSINPGDGKKTFRTQISLSSGISIDGSGRVTYSEMSYSGANDLREVDGINNSILPGVSDSQFSSDRNGNPDAEPPKKEGGGFGQPNLGTSVDSPIRQERKKK